MGSEARAPSSSNVDEIGPFQPQWTVGIFGALVSNDRAAVRAEKGKEEVNLARCQHGGSHQRNSFFFTFTASLQRIDLPQHFLTLRSLATFHFFHMSTERVALGVMESRNAVGFLHYIFERRKKTVVCVCLCLCMALRKRKKITLSQRLQSRQSDHISVSSLKEQPAL